ncbi:hypothetical protein LguiB_032639 [Lonicera macranthoides]
MAHKFRCNFFTPLVVICTLFSSFNLLKAAELTISSYIIHTDIHSRPSLFSTQDEWYSSIIHSLTDPEIDSITSTRIFYTYDIVLQGFAARLTDQEAGRLANVPGVLAVTEDMATVRLDTTRIVDSGIWPESESFNDGGLGPVPSRWKGTCENGTAFNSSHCNKKLIGARFFLKGMERHISGGSVESFSIYRSPRDEVGHGTHTASTAAGAEVTRVSLFGFAEGHARGIATKARVAMYKVCGFFCVDSDIIAAIESAIADGVDVLSISLGSKDQPYHENAIAKGAFAAMKRNIFVACSGGNSGPHPYSVHNTAPWITTVGAGSMDRVFPVRIRLGNNVTFIGSSLYADRNSTSASFPLVFLGSCRMIPLNITRKIVICNSTKARAVENGVIIQAGGGAGLIQLNHLIEGEELLAIAYTLPAATIGYKETLALLSYINSTQNPTASFESHNTNTVIGKDRAPITTSFSARGPNPIVKEVLKPDLIAPGLNILAAWPSNISPTRSLNDPRRVKFNTDSGTSMACPHVAGLAALIRANHPDWTAAAIRSALMTTASTTDNQDRLIARYEDMGPTNALAIGAGHVNPQLAGDPGLIYDANESDYIRFLCSLNYTENQIKLFAPVSCPGTKSSSSELNYPSFSVVFRLKGEIRELKRTVTNVGEFMGEVYEARIVNYEGEKVKVSVKPTKMIFNKYFDKQSYTIIFESNSVFLNFQEIVFGSVSWESDRHVVRSPFSVMWEPS